VKLPDGGTAIAVEVHAKDPAGSTYRPEGATANNFWVVGSNASAAIRPAGKPVTYGVHVVADPSAFAFLKTPSEVAA
jgi:hypothetical protein